MISACLQAEISVALGQTWGKYLQTLATDNNGQRSLHQSELSGRLSLWYELDSRDHPLFLENDQVVYGIGLLQETRYQDALLPEDRTLIIPLYATYYLNYAQLGLGAGLNVALMDLRTPRRTTTLGQQLGKHFALRYNFTEGYIESMVMQNCAEGMFSVQGSEVTSFYDMTQYILRCGWYLN
jgi:hypothetical protein